MKVRYLNKPINIGCLQLKNRIVMPAINHSYSKDGTVPERLIALYKRRAEGGTALITVGGCAVAPEGRSSDIICIYDDSFLPGLKKLVTAVHEAGSKIAPQLYHAGGYAKSKDTGEQAIAPSTYTSRYTHEQTRTMSIEEIENTIEKFVQAAQRAKTAGFDAVEVIASAGYLIAEFLSPFTNKRTDEYGGKLENRTRLLVNIIKRIKQELGANFPVIIRLSGSDFVSGGNTNKEAVQIAKIIEANGADAINVTGGWHESVIPQTTGELPQGGYNFLAKDIKQAVSIPVIASNRINTPEQGELLIAAGMSDMVSLGRALLADPDFANKVATGKTEEIRSCIACGQGCYDRRFSGQDVMCMINYQAGRELEYILTMAPQAKNILVVGGGVAGMEFALKAAARGHKLTLWEQSGKLGGQLHYANKPEGKHDFTYLVSYYTNMLANSTVQVELNKQANIQNIIACKPDAVVLATGSLAMQPPFPVSPENENFLQANDILSGHVVAGKQVVVIGGGAVGCETAIFMADQATLSAEQVKFLLTNDALEVEDIKRLLNTSSRSITIIEMQDKTGKDIGISTKWGVKKQIQRLGIKEFTNSKVLAVTESGVIVENQQKEKVFLAADTVVLAIGSIAPNQLDQQVKKAIKETYLIGDAVKAGKIMAAINDANELALKL